jgi:hypothetical protein
MKDDLDELIARSNRIRRKAYVSMGLSAVAIVLSLVSIAWSLYRYLR